MGEGVADWIQQTVPERQPAEKEVHPSRGETEDEKVIDGVHDAEDADREPADDEGDDDEEKSPGRFVVLRPQFSR